jgi:undecaprenyl-diphosphatase
MIESLYGIDRAVFLFINSTLSNPVGDLVWPYITDYDKLLPVRILLIGVWIFLIVRGGVRGRTAALMIIPVLAISDTVSSRIIKELIARPRPCAEIGGVPIIAGIHQLVSCGPGKSFPSSHAVNNFAVATVFSWYYRKYLWAFVSWASLIAISRPAVGVHYPSDILGGAVFGTAMALMLILLWNAACRKWFTALEMPAHPGPMP